MTYSVMPTDCTSLLFISNVHLTQVSPERWKQMSEHTQYIGNKVQFVLHYLLSLYKLHDACTAQTNGCNADEIQTAT